MQFTFKKRRACLPYLLHDKATCHRYLSLSQRGKAPLRKRILHNRAGLRVALSVNDMNEVSIDAALLPAALAGQPA